MDGQAPGDTLLTPIKAMRPKQWTKNALLFAALIFSQRFTETDLWMPTLLGFAAFCMVSSSGYIFNDIRDREADAKHPRKCKRPIASGELTVPMAQVEMAVLMLFGCVLAWMVSTDFLLVTLLYFVTTMSYTFVFKHMVILDVMFIAAGFLWRAAAGAVAIGVVISPWLLTCTGFLAMFLGFNKRRGELRLLSGAAAEHRKNLALYTPELVLEFQAITTSGTVISYALYTVLASPTPWLLMTLPHVLYGVFRYMYLVTATGDGGAPEETLLRDKPILLTVGLYIVTVVGILALT